MSDPREPVLMLAGIALACAGAATWAFCGYGSLLTLAVGVLIGVVTCALLFVAGKDGAK